MDNMNLSYGDASEKGGEKNDLTGEVFKDAPALRSKDDNRDLDVEAVVGEKVGGIIGGVRGNEQDKINAENIVVAKEGSELNDDGEEYASMWQDGKIDNEEAQRIKQVEARSGSDFASFNDEVEKMSEQYLKTVETR